MKNIFRCFLFAILTVHNVAAVYACKPILDNLFAIKPDTTAPKFSYTETIHDSIFVGEFENDMLMRLKINDIWVPAAEIGRYTTFLEKAQIRYDAHKAPKRFYGKTPFDITKMPRNLEYWEKKIKESLVADGLISLDKHYKIEFGDLIMRINGKEMTDEIYKKYLAQYKEITGVELNSGYILSDE